MPKERKKYSLVQCRIEACQKIDELAEKEKISKNKAMKLLAQQTGVSFNTLEWWYYSDPESGKSSVVSQGTQTVDNSNKVRTKVAKKALQNLVKSVDEQRSDSQRETLRATADEQLSEAGTVIVAEELYELFRDSTSKVDQLITANSELEDPINAEKLYVEILRLARNAGWEEPKCACDGAYCERCEITVGKCPNRMCKNYTGGK